MPQQQATADTSGEQRHFLHWQLRCSHQLALLLGCCLSSSASMCCQQLLGCLEALWQLWMRYMAACWMSFKWQLLRWG